MRVNCYPSPSQVSRLHKRSEAHPHFTRLSNLHIFPPASGSRAPSKDRRTVLAAVAEAAYIKKVSTKYVLTGIYSVVSRSHHTHILRAIHKNHDQPESYQACADQRNEPENILLCCPAIQKQTHRDSKSSRNHGR